MDVLAILFSDPTININLISGHMSVCSLVTPLLTKDTSVSLLMANYMSPKMLSSMSSNILTMIFFHLQPTLSFPLGVIFYLLLIFLLFHLLLMHQLLLNMLKLILLLLVLIPLYPPILNYLILQMSHHLLFFTLLHQTLLSMNTLTLFLI